MNSLKIRFYTDKKADYLTKTVTVSNLILYTNAGNTEREAIGVMVKQDLEELGMKVNFKPVEFNSLVNKLVSTFDWDMVIMGLTGSPLEPNGGKNVWLSDGSSHIQPENTCKKVKRNSSVGKGTRLLFYSRSSCQQNLKTVKIL